MIQDFLQNHGVSVGAKGGLRMEKEDEKTMADDLNALRQAITQIERDAGDTDGEDFSFFIRIGDRDDRVRVRTGGRGADGGEKGKDGKDGRNVDVRGAREKSQSALAGRGGTEPPTRRATAVTEGTAGTPT